MKKVIILFAILFSTQVFAQVDYNVISKSKAQALSSSASIQENDWNQSFTDVQQLPPAPQIFPTMIPILQGGKVGDITELMPRFSITSLRPLDLAKDSVKKMIGVFQGGAFSRIRLHEIEEKLIGKAKQLQENGFDVAKTRYRVQYKDSVVSAGIGGGGAASGAGIEGGTGASGSLAILPGFHRSTVDPMFILKFYLVE